MLWIIYIAGLAARLIHKIEDRTLTNEEMMRIVKWQPISYIYKKRLFICMHAIYYGKCHALLSGPFEKREIRTWNNELQFEKNDLKETLAERV